MCVDGEKGGRRWNECSVSGVCVVCGVSVLSVCVGGVERFTVHHPISCQQILPILTDTSDVIDDTHRP